MTQPSRTAAPRFDRGALFRLSRMLHAYLSALAFMTLLFFSITGVLLNHPEWFASYVPKEREATAVLSRPELATALAAPEPGRGLAAAVEKHIPLRGAYSSADRQDGAMLVRLEGPKGSSDLDIDLASGQVRARVATADLTSVMLDLHRGKNSGAAWRGLIDVSAALITVLSVIGFVLFFSLRLRLRNSLILTGAGLVALLALAVWSVR